MAQPALCIDTDILIDFLRSREDQPSVLELALQRHSCALPSITVYEVCFGIERYGRHEDRRRLQDLLNAVEVVSFDAASARASAQLDAALQRRGMRLDFPDLFIAGICLANKLPLLTRNLARFSRIPHLTLLDPRTLRASLA